MLWLIRFWVLSDKFSAPMFSSHTTSSSSGLPLTKPDEAFGFGFDKGDVGFDVDNRCAVQQVCTAAIEADGFAGFDAFEF